MPYPEAHSAQRRKVLLAGAEPSVQRLISTFLLTMGWPCTVVKNLEEAHVILQKEAFDAVIIDLGGSEAQAEQAILRIRQMRPSVGDRTLVIGGGADNHRISELVERHDLIRLSPEGLLPQLWATLQELLVSPRPRELPSRGMPVARMVFDSSRHPLPAGIRGPSPEPRQIAYQHKRMIIDLSIHSAGESGRIFLADQVLDGERKGKNDRLPVLLVGGTGTLARTATNQFGEFQLQCDFPADVGLEIRLAERSWV